MPGPLRTGGLDSSIPTVGSAGRTGARRVDTFRQPRDTVPQRRRLWRCP
ncbi:MAG: hypothetical protein MZV64_72780 [Ignavibacteriales bacterium]|nr:hypothetical protein [Ignavibacteriales bacterium]